MHPAHGRAWPLLLLVLLAAAMFAARPLAQTEVAVVNIIVGAGHAPLWLAEEHALFAKHGLTAKVTVVESSELDRKLGVDHPFGVVGAAAAIASTAAGRPIKILYPLGSGRAGGILVTRPQLSSPADLRGRRLGVARVGTGYWLLTILALQHLGIDPGRDSVTFAELGDLPRIVRAMQDGDIDGAVVDSAQGQQLIQQGFNGLLDLAQANLSGVPSALVASADYVSKHPDVVARVVTTIAEGTAFGLASKNKPLVLKTIAARMQLKSDATTESAYRAFVSAALRKPYLDLTVVESMIRVMAVNDPEVLKLKAADLVDDRFVRHLDATGGLDRLFRTYGVK
jgi:ABC-type nitrate/sulfonate/bicarbonate transport system substrate-binding protein